MGMTIPIVTTSMKMNREYKMEKYNGWTNYDTWEAFNILTSIESAYLETLQNLNLSRSVFVSRSSKLIKVFYAKYEIEDNRIDLKNVNWSEIVNALKE